LAPNGRCDAAKGTYNELLSFSLGTVNQAFVQQFFAYRNPLGPASVGLGLGARPADVVRLVVG